MGQSGDPFSPWYRDQWPYWYDGNTFALPFTDPAIQAHDQHTLRLTAMTRSCCHDSRLLP